MIYNKLTLKDLEKTLNKLSKKTSQLGKETNQFTVLTGMKGSKLFDLAILNEANPMKPEVFNLKWEAIVKDAYIHSGWDYFRYSTNLKVDYNNSHTNEIFEDVDIDYYDNPISIYVGRK